MTPLAITIKSPEKIGGNVLIEMSAARFEKLAADLGLFNTDFLKSMERAEKDVRAGRVYKLNSLKELRK